jgi:hypothetical protein
MTLHPTVEDVMLDPAHFQSAGLIDDQVPDRFGLYAIRTRDLAALTDPYRAIAEERCSDLMIGHLRPSQDACVHAFLN